jgi:hypothetical protein
VLGDGLREQAGREVSFFAEDEVARELQSYHHAWLSVHPHRSVEWLSERMADGFDVHHIDGDHANDEPSNLVLIECADHMRLHGQPGMIRVLAKPRILEKRRRRCPSKQQLERKEKMALRRALAEEIDKQCQSGV